MGLHTDDRRGNRPASSPKVTEVTQATLADLGKRSGHTLNEQTWNRVEQRIRIDMARGSKAFFVEWSGTKTPKGATILGKAIDQADDGQVFCDRGELLGTYARLAQYQGPSGDQHSMVISVPNRKDAESALVLRRCFI